MRMRIGWASALKNPALKAWSSPVGWAMLMSSSLY